MSMNGYLRAAFVIGCALAATDRAGAGDAEDVYKAFRGTWRFVSVVMEGQKMPAPDVKGMRLIIRGRDFQVKDGDMTYGGGTFELNVDARPRQINIKWTSGPDKGQAMLGIYELKGDTYRVCLGVPGKDRPKDFVSKPGSGHVLEVLKRGKAVSRADAVRAERKRLEGRWQAVTYALDGKEAAAADLKRVQLIFDAEGRTVAVQDGKPFLRSTTKIDPTADLKMMDITFTLGGDKGKTAPAIYKVDGDTLTICRSAPGMDRPTKFSSKAGSGHTLMVYSRRKQDAPAEK
jgi:uncharacterized protein (TIGR03067 family)